MIGNEIATVKLASRYTEIPQKYNIVLTSIGEIHESSTNVRSSILQFPPKAFYFDLLACNLGQMVGRVDKDT